MVCVERYETRSANVLRTRRLNANAPPRLKPRRRKLRSRRPRLKRKKKELKLRRPKPR